MSIRRLFASLFCAGALLAVTSPAAAQPIGTFRWQLAPYCNVVTLAVTVAGSGYRLEGTDDQCGAATRAAAIGTAFVNADGAIGLGFTVVTGGAAPVHVSARVTAPSFGGTWRDSAGDAGALVFNPPAPAAGPPRAPTGRLGGVAVDPVQIQRRVTGVCPAGAFVRQVAENGGVVCAPVGGATGDITAVTAGAGLTGGGASGDVALAVSFAGPGAASTAARSDHTHQRLDPTNTNIGAAALDSILNSATNNTAVGNMALEANSSGSSNTGIGYRAGSRNLVGNRNSVVGAWAWWDGRGHANTVIGASAMGNTPAGDGNTAVGARAAFAATTATGNTAVGEESLVRLTTGVGNIAIGRAAGAAVTTGRNNIFIGGDTEFPTDTGAIHIGSDSTHTQTYIAGIHGASVFAASDLPVLVDSVGKLGTAVSSRRFKTDIVDLGATATRLQALRPVSFRYLPEARRGDATEFGLIAEEVAAVLPELVVNDREGQPFTVRYHQLAPLLVAEVQRLQRERAVQEARLDALSAQVAAQAEAIAALQRLLATRADR